MKKLNVVFLVAILVILSSCSKGDVVSGSPLDSKVRFEDIVLSLSSTEVSTASGQRFPVNIVLPKSFSTDVIVELTSFVPSINKRLKRSFTVPANTTSFAASMTAVGGDQTDVLPFNLNLEVFVSGINYIDIEGKVPQGFLDVIYKPSSNKLILDYGDSATGNTFLNRCLIRLDWQGPHTVAQSATYNDLNMVARKLAGPGNLIVNGNSSGVIYGAIAGTSRYEFINFNGTADNTSYILSVWAKKLIVGAGVPTNLPYRFTIRFPDAKTKTISGVFNNISEGKRIVKR